MAHLWSILLTLLSLFMWGLPVSALVLAWDPSARAQGYKLSSGPQSGHYDQVLDTGSATTVEVTTLVSGARYFFAAQAYNTDGLSDYSNEVTVVAQATMKPPIYTINNGWLTWEWMAGDDPAVTNYDMACGDTPGQYTVHKIFPITQTLVPMVEMVGRNPGVWYCQMSMLAGTTVRSVSNEFPFDYVGGVLLKGMRK